MSPEKKLRYSRIGSKTKNVKLTCNMAANTKQIPNSLPVCASIFSVNKNALGHFMSRRSEVSKSVLLVLIALHDLGK